ncbi:MAG: NAD(+) diphosphatase, partial [Caulobacterales bacterium]|nr:NAD(+) diphosphatase [Caulobacterales bacterium]
MTRPPAPDLAAAGLAFASDPLDRHDEARGDADRIAGWRRDPAARIAVMREGRPLVRPKDEGFAAAYFRAEDLAGADLVEEVFLGCDERGAVFAAALRAGEEEDAPAPGWAGGAQFEDMWRRVHLFAPDEANVLGAARALLGWHRRHRFCANCGHETELRHAGWRRQCPACGAEHYPRTDPVSIMVIVRGERMLLGRNARFPDAMFSCLAGFVEAGETLEGATRREAFEEAGVRIGRVDYLASQPWPFPSSLMIGVRAEALSDDAVPDGVEIAEVRWFTR